MTKRHCALNANRRMREQYLKDIREACRVANPEISSRGKCHASCGKRFPDEVRLADVLLAMNSGNNKRWWAVDCVGEIIELTYKEGTEQATVVETDIYWNLRKDDLTEQSDECLEFLADLLK
jgi:hypothetical protein